MKLRVVILCCGMGTRLKEETEYCQKPMVKIGEKPILWQIMKIYSHYGFKDFAFCFAYKSKMIKEYFYNYEILNNDFTVELSNHNHIEIYNNLNEKG